MGRLGMIRMPCLSDENTMIRKKRSHLSLCYSVLKSKYEYLAVKSLHPLKP